MASPAGPAAMRSDAVSPTEAPEFFESGGLPVYGMYYRPREARAGAPVVVHCHSLGVEQLTNYRNEVLAARAASARGIPTFRFHARGHGDSAGNFADVTMETLVEGALAAADRARQLSGASRVIWLGTRFGALVAAHALSRRDDSAGLVLWEPVTKVADYVRAMLRTLLMSQLAAGQRPDATVDEMLARLEREGMVDVHGYYLHRPVVTTASRQDLDAVLAAWSGPTLLAQVQSRRSMAPPLEALAQSLGVRGAAVRVERIAEEPGWHFVSNPAWRSPALIQLTMEWLDAVA